MKIIKKSATGHSAKFKVLRPFLFQAEFKEEDVGKKELGPAIVKPGDVITVTDPIEQVSFCKCKKVEPLLPETAVYVALTPFILPGSTAKFECKKMELVELRDSDALPLLLNGSILPKDDSAWRPFGKTLKGKPKMTEKEIAELDQARLEETWARIGILQKGGK